MSAVAPRPSQSYIAVTRALDTIQNNQTLRHQNSFHIHRHSWVPESTTAETEDLLWLHCRSSEFEEIIWAPSLAQNHLFQNSADGINSFPHLAYLVWQIRLL